jgi:hypothetical protein
MLDNKGREILQGNFRNQNLGTSKNQAKENSYGVQLVELLYFVK